MIRKILTSMLALSIAATSAFSFLSASADSKGSGKMVKINVQGYMANEWLAEHDEFDITFEHDGERTYGFFNKDNNFVCEIELEKGTEYTVTMSDDFEGYVVQGFDETYVPDKDGAIIMVTALPTEEKKEETDGKLIMDDEELAEYKKQRELVQQFIDLTEKYGLCDDSNEYWQALSEEGKKSIVACQWCTSEKFKEDIEYGRTDNETLKNHFAFEFLYSRYYDYCYEGGHRNDTYIEMFTWGSGENGNNEYTEYLANYDSMVKPIADYEQYYIDKYDEMPDLYAVYLDIINGVEFEENDEDEVSSISDSQTDENSVGENTSSLIVEDSSVSGTTLSTVTTTSRTENSAKENNQSGLVNALKDNIVTIILAIVLGGALLYIKKIKTKDKKTNDDY